MRKKGIFLTVLALLVMGTWGSGQTSASTQEVAISFPIEGRVSLRMSQIRLVGRVKSALSEVELKISGKAGESRQKVAVSEGAFQYLLDLAPGETRVDLMAGGSSVDSRTFLLLAGADAPPPAWPELFQHSKGDLTANCRDCHLIDLRGTPNYKHLEQKIDCTASKCHPTVGKAKFLHGPVQEKFCIGCHNPHGGTGRKFTSAGPVEADLCYTCHETEKDTFAEGVVHYPIAKGECLSCHDPHQSDFEFHLKRGTIKELCSACHGYERLKHKYTHEPVKEEDCIACHAPHSSPYKNLQVKDGEEMCLECHTIRKEEFSLKNIHKPVAEDCNLCHDPHGSETPFHLRTQVDEKGNYIISKRPFRDACLICHRKLNPEMVKTMETAKYTHVPVEEDKCTACHTPHSTNYQKQLKAPLAENCYVCHVKLKEHIMSSPFKHGPVRTNDCAQCHLVHGGPYKHLLRDAFPDEFYVDFDEKEYKLCFNCHNPIVVRQETGRDTGFRNGEVNLHYVHVNRKKGRTCSTCHEVHASEQEKHIRSKVPYRGRHTISLAYTVTATGGGCVVGCHKPRNYDREKAAQN